MLVLIPMVVDGLARMYGRDVLVVCHVSFDVCLVSIRRTHMAAEISS